jgi:hypothetical protein
MGADALMLDFSLCAHPLFVMPMEAYPQAAGWLAVQRPAV